MYSTRAPSWLLPCLALLLIANGTATLLIASEYGGSLGWLDAINLRRSEAGLPPLAEDASLSAGARLHSRYVVKTGSQALHEVHAEDPKSPWYSVEGDAAGRIGNVMSSAFREATDQFAVDSWTQGPFHLLAYLSPTLRAVGFGSYREHGGRVQMAASLPLGRGRRSGSEVAGLYPVLWPGNGATIKPPLLQYCPPGTACFTSEMPDPLTSCGYGRPAGLPIVMQLGPGTVTPRVSSSRISSGDTGWEHCVIDETSYANADTRQQAATRALLKNLSAVVLVPKRPLPLGLKYTVRVDANGSVFTWAFNIEGAARRQSPRNNKGRVE